MCSPLLPSVNQWVSYHTCLLSPPLQINSFSFLRINRNTPILPLYQPTVPYTSQPQMAWTSLFVCVCLAESEWKFSPARWAPVITGWDSFLIILSNINPVGWCRPSCGLMDNVITAKTPSQPHSSTFYCSLHPLPPSLLTHWTLSFSFLYRSFQHNSLPHSFSVSTLLLISFPYTVFMPFTCLLLVKKKKKKRAVKNDRKEKITHKRQV